ncbi:MAG: patatin-like phospholipase family protein [Planctomycetes bacterium]|nr:patatin-like phospholipase family protein [Planctomycetota bacterium]
MSNAMNSGENPETSENASAATAETPPDPAKQRNAGTAARLEIAGDGGALRLSDILNEELFSIHGPAGAADLSSIVDENERRLKIITKFHEYNRRSPRTALCLSGGGIRSATFCLGVLQGLATRKLLLQFDYLSTVSGGGYIGSWLSKWMQLDPRGVDEVERSLGKFNRKEAINPEQKPIAFVRNYGNFLIPRLGLFSADAFAGLSATIRNMIINWLVLLPVLMAALLLPNILYEALMALAAPGGNVSSVWEAIAPLGAWLAGIVALVFLLVFLPSHSKVQRQFGDRQFLLRIMLPLSATIILCMVFEVISLGNPNSFFHALVRQLWGNEFLVFVIPALAVHIIAFFISKAFGSAATTLNFIAFCISGIFTGALTWTATTLVPPIINDEHGGVLCELLGLQPRQNLRLYTCVFPTVMAIEFWLAYTVYILVNDLRNHKHSQTDREWWARAGGWMVAIAFVWTIGAGIAVFHDEIFDRMNILTKTTIGAVGGMAGIATTILGFSKKTSAKGGKQSKSILAPAHKILTIVGVLFLVTILAALSHAIGEWAHAEFWNGDSGDHAGLGLIYLMIVGTMLILSLAVSFVVGVNRYSLHSVYGMRLGRAFLGASNNERKADVFTNFDPDDNIDFSKIWPGTVSAECNRSKRPFHIINTALNVRILDDDELSWQQRKAASFTMSPLHCGSHWIGYRETKNYGSKDGISLARAMTISGAAASPNMGYHSSPTVTFLLTLFNIRLGSWLPNPGTAALPRQNRHEPKFPLSIIFRELFGLTSRKDKYIYLSDGGHFENLGLYEMALRRCAKIVVVDSGEDGGRQFEDLGNAIRKIRVDLGIVIEFEGINFDAGGAAGKIDAKSTRCAIGKIHYSSIDGPDATEGTIIYIKPTLHGAESPDVLNYWKQFPDFPHQSTADQFFDEPQFESYRKLGKKTVDEICGDVDGVWTIDALQQAANQYIKNKQSPAVRAL